MTTILAIETSCDETAAAIIADGQHIQSNVVASQIDIHRRYGGVFPEVASRQHILAIDTVIQDALTQANVNWADLDAVAVTYGPGLSGSLLVGVNAAKGIAMAQQIPLIGVNHLEGHLYSNWLKVDDVLPEIVFPVLCLIVSGGHTELVLVRDHQDYEILGRTIDDAAGEAFDKAARLMGLGYPGGPAVQKAAVGGDPKAFKLPRAKTKRPYDFSFSGLKTAVLRAVQKYNDQVQRPADVAPEGSSADVAPDLPVADLAASTQTAIVDALVTKTKAAAEAFEVTQVLISGGVSANAALREAMTDRLSHPVRYPPLFLCTDNAAMIGAVAHWRFLSGDVADWDLDVIPNLQLSPIHYVTAPT
ncbi:MAG: tRNA (adenosine(37)-N6)-threonylcarbamoyltransferase complex transferase subunit TsaD [Chloroflexota bacterium]